jgi:hypothetical protein
MIHAGTTKESRYLGKLVWHQILYWLMPRHRQNFLVVLLKWHLMITYVPIKNHEIATNEEVELCLCSIFLLPNLYCILVIMLADCMFFYLRDKNLCEDLRLLDKNSFKYILKVSIFPILFSVLDKIAPFISLPIDEITHYKKSPLFTQ